MSFLNGWAIAIGVAALVAPLAVHLLTRPRPVSYPLSTIRFLREVIRERRARSRLRDLLVLLLRMLVVGLLAMALARPLLEQSPVVAAQATSATSRVVVVDVSLSMSAGVGSTALQRAQATALRYLDYSPGMRADVILLGAQPRAVYGRLSPNFASLRDAVRQASTRAERADVRAAMDEAGRLLDGASGQLELVIISDFQRGNWDSLFLDRIPEACRVQLESVAGDSQRNIAITAVRFPSQPIVRQQTLLEVEVANHSDQSADVRCRVDFGAWQQTLEGRLAPQSQRVLSGSVVFPEAGWHSGWARLDAGADALPADDVRPAAVEVANSPRVLLVSRQPPEQKPSSSFYLEQALRVVVGAGEQTKLPDSSVTRIQPQRTDAGRWPTVDLFVIDHPGVLPPAALAHVGSRVRRGYALLYVASEPADAMNLRQLADSLGAGFEPPVELVPPAVGLVRKDLFVRQIQSREGPFRVFGDAGAAAMRAVRFGGGLATRLTKEGLKSQVLASLSDSSALLYLTSCDAGQIAVLNADLDQSNWCLEASFLPVVGELLQSLLAGRSPPGEAFCGEPLVRLLPAEVAADAALAATVADQHSPPSGEYGRWEWSAEQGSLVWSWADPAGAGIYQLAENNRIVAMSATAAPPSESNLNNLDQTVLQGRLAGSREVGYRDQSHGAEREDQLWNWLIAACALGLASEVLVLRSFRS